MGDYIGPAFGLYTIALATDPPPPPPCPLILDLDGDGVETTSVTDGTHFDHDANGFAEQTGWAASDDGLLVWDRNGDGRINNGRELFGNNTILKNSSRAADGFQALAEWDDNADGRIDLSDSVWSNLKVWQDYNGDGYSNDYELYTLDEVGITGLSTAYTNSNVTDPNGNTLIMAGAFQKSDMSTGQMSDYSFRHDPKYTVANEWMDVSPDIAALADLRGYGNVYDLQQAMARDISGQLKSLVEQFMAATDPNVRNSLMDQILFKWTGSDGINPSSRGPNIDARKLSVLEKFFGQAFVGVGNSFNPNVYAASVLNQSYKGIFEMSYAALMSQTHLKNLYDEILYTWDEATQSLKGDLSAVIIQLQNRIATDEVSGKKVLGEFAHSIRCFHAEDLLVTYK